MNKGVIFRAYPDKAQQELINKTLGCSRLVYNKGLAFRNEKYAKGEKTGYTRLQQCLLL
jgi:putative transposase